MPAQAVLCVAEVCFNICLEVHNSARIAGLNRNDFAFIESVTLPLADILGSVWESAKRGEVGQHHPGLADALRNLLATLTDLNGIARKWANRTGFVRFLLSRDIRDELKDGFSRLHICLTALQTAFSHAQGTRLQDQVHDVGSLVERLQSHQVERFEGLEAQAKACTNRMAQMGISMEQLLSGLQYANPAALPYHQAGNATGQLGSCDMEIEQYYLLQIADFLESLPDQPGGLTPLVTPGAIDQDAVKQLLKCPICLEMMEDAVTTNTGHNFCSACIQRWRNKGGPCPLTRLPLVGVAQPNCQLRQLVNFLKTIPQQPAPSSPRSSISSSSTDTSCAAGSAAAAPSAPPYPLPEGLDQELRQLQGKVQSPQPSQVIPAINRLLQLLQEAPERYPEPHQQQLRELYQARVSGVLVLVGPCPSTSTSLHPGVAVHLLRHQGTGVGLLRCLWGAGEQAAGNAMALIAHLLNSDHSLKSAASADGVAAGLRAHAHFCERVSCMQQPGGKERIGLLLLRLLHSSNLKVCGQAAETLAALIDCPGTAGYCREALNQAISGEWGQSEEEVHQAAFNRLLELVGGCCESQPMVAGAAAMALLGLCQPGMCPEVLKAQVASSYSSSSSSGGLSLGQAVARLMDSEDEVVLQRAGFLVEAFCGLVSWEPCLWLDTWRGLSHLLGSRGLRTRTLGARVLLRLLGQEPPAGLRPSDWQQQLQQECYETLQVAVRGFTEGAQMAFVEGLCLGPKLMVQLLERLRGCREVGEQLRSSLQSLRRLLASLASSGAAGEAGRAAGEALRYVDDHLGCQRS